MIAVGLDGNHSMEATHSKLDHAVASPTAHPRADRSDLEIVCCLSLGDAQAAHHLRPLALCDQVRTLWIVRPRPLAESELPKAQYCIVGTRWRLWRVCRMALQCIRLARRPDVRLLVSFNPLPYGLIALLAGWLANKPVHCGMIGSDWYLRLRRPWARGLLPLLRSAWLTTVPGASTLEETVARGFSRDRTTPLPHAIDLKRFPVAQVSAPPFDCVFVGRLVPVKRVDRILDAWALIVRRHPTARCCIVGDGPLRPALSEQAARLNLLEHVTFVGHQPDVSRYLAKARIILCASDSEGFPFALVEGLCTGLVPVATPVGAIPDFLVDGWNGLLVPPGDAARLAEAICRLLDDPDLLAKLRANALSQRDHFSEHHAVAMWTRQFARLPGSTSCSQASPKATSRDATSTP